MGTYTLEKMYEIWNDKTGFHIEVGPDRDGMDLIEIRERDDGNRIGGRITLDQRQAELLMQALTDLLDDKHISEDVPTRDVD